MTVYEFPSPATSREPPEFTLYSDGHVIYTRAPDGLRFDLRHAQVDDAAMESLTRAAIAALRNARASYQDVEQFDLSTTIFEIDTLELNKSVSVYALGEADDQAPSAGDRASMRPLRDLLLNFDDEVQAGNATDLGEYEPEQYRVELIDAADELPGRIDWPWPTLDPTDFEPAEARSRTRIMSRSEVAEVLPFAGGEYLVATAADGGRYVIYLTPLLPDGQRA